jgi:hypothetical protein
MDIPLTLRTRRDGSLVYAIPLWYRSIMVAILALLVTGATIEGGQPSVVGWVFIALSALAALYEESWVVEAHGGNLHHRYGVLPILRHLSVERENIEGLALTAFVRGSLPGSPAEAAESADILSSFAQADGGDRAAMRDIGKDKPRYKKAYVSLVLKTRDGESYSLNTVPARRIGELRRAGAKFAEALGSGFEEG